ncbi:MAG: hypothetical protein B7Y39_01335 [Bdellovibrio sp. 28-41-41]|nr:MAG: hypothetical protein B7Y39_01335 [Bdellovibrio sp. 28-41-41]
MNELIKEEEREEGTKTGKQKTKTKKIKSAEDDQYRVVIQKESNDALEELVRRTNDGFEGGEVTKSDVVNLLISNHAKSFSDSEIKNLRLLHFDEKKVLRALLRKAGDDGDLPSEIKKVLREHLGISDSSKRRASKSAFDLSTEKSVDN